MAKLDHLAVTVADLMATRDWYTSVLGLKVEFDTGNASGLKDDDQFTLIFSQDGGLPSMCSLYFQVADVQIAHEEIAGRGVMFRHPPQ